MSNDFILGCMVGFLFTGIVALILSISYKKLSRKIYKKVFEVFKNFTVIKNFMVNARRIIRVKNNRIQIYLNIFFDLVILYSVFDILGTFNILSFFALIISIILSVFIVHAMCSLVKSSKLIDRVTLGCSLNVGLYSFIIGIYCCLSGWKLTYNLAYGGIFIGIGSFSMMFYIALTQILDSQQKDKSVKN